MPSFLGAAGEQEENGLGASASGPARTLTQNVLLGSRVVSQKVNFLGQGNKGGSSRLPLGEERANILLLACCYQEGWPRAGLPAPASPSRSAAALAPPVRPAPCECRSPAFAASPSTKLRRRFPATPAPGRTWRNRSAAAQ